MVLSTTAHDCDQFVDKHAKLLVTPTYRLLDINQSNQLDLQKLNGTVSQQVG